MVEFLMISGKLATLDLLKIEELLNKVYDVITLACDVTNKILSLKSVYIVNMVM